MNLCHHCGGQLELEARPSRSDICPHCSSDLRCCKNCQLFSPSAHNQCEDPVTEWVADREKSNFCDQFQFKDSSASSTDTEADKSRDAWKKLFGDS